MIFREWSWNRRATRMRKYTSAGALAAEEGLPDHVVQIDGREIWHYPLGYKRSRVYSIHVVVADDSINQAYVVGEPAQ